ncbi:hypothetical protein NFI96_004620 [Prochilodus magdalenae]|nr:hypothetical protein NFI96_004620 [Prochilodus magdalenae]
MDANIGNSGRGVRVRGGGWRGRGRGRPRTVTSDEIQATLVDHVVNHGLTMRESGQRVQPNLSRYTVASIIRTFRNENSDTTIIKFADDATVMGLITGGDETAYRMEVANLVAWCQNITATRRQASTPGDVEEAVGGGAGLLPQLLCKEEQEEYCQSPAK